MSQVSAYTEEKGDVICERIIAGESLRSICADEDMPCTTTVCKWLRDIPAFAQQYAHAREAQADTLFDDILEIADDGRNDWMARHGEDDAGWQANGEHIQRAKLRVDARKWMAGKLRPKKYGDRVAHDHGVQPDNPLSDLLSEIASHGRKITD
ncbi:terminase small subunit protein [Roseibium sp.]|uniref:terminase small subunit-like protein n=1 Tax=Roseibium sp. TaxID=1936156 RepID=UPI003276DE4F